MARISTDQADRLHALLENVDLENAVVNILLPAQTVDLTLDEVRNRLCLWLAGLGHDPSRVSAVRRFAGLNFDRIVIEYIDADDLVLDTASIVLPSFPWTTDGP